MRYLASSIALSCKVGEETHQDTLKCTVAMCSAYHAEALLLDNAVEVDLVHHRLIAQRIGGLVMFYKAMLGSNRLMEARTVLMLRLGRSDFWRSSATNKAAPRSASVCEQRAVHV